MVLNCKVSCEVNLSKVRKYKEEDDEKITKIFTCEICSKSFNRKDNMQRHIYTIHLGKRKGFKMENSIGFETVQDENKYI